MSVSVGFTHFCSGDSVPVRSHWHGMRGVVDGGGGAWRVGCVRGELCIRACDKNYIDTYVFCIKEFERLTIVQNSYWTEGLKLTEQAELSD